MNSNLSELKEKISGKGYYLYFIHDPTIFHIVDEYIHANLEFHIELEYISLFDFHLNHSKYLILTSKVNDHLYLSISQMEQLKRILLDIHETRNDYELIIIMYYLEHAAFSKDDNYFPGELFERDIWSAFYLPEIQINDIHIHHSFSDRLFKPMTQCLYHDEYFKQIIQKDSISKNISFVELNSQGIRNLYDMVKYDSIRNIQNEKKNADMIRSLLTADLAYQIRKTSSLTGEFTGALCACADSFDTKPLGEILSQSQQYNCLINIFNSLFEAFKQLYSLGKTTIENSGIEKYIQKMISVPLEITFFQKPLEPANEDMPLSEFSWDELFEQDHHKEYIFQLFDIIPDFEFPDQYKMIFNSRIVIDNISTDCQIYYIDKDPMWREIFNAAGIQVGKKYKLRKVKFENFLSNFIDTLAELQFIYDEQDIDAKDKKHQLRTEIESKEYVWFKKKNYLNPSKFIRDTNNFEKFTQDYCQLALGNAKIDNILFLNKFGKKYPTFINLAYLATDYPASYDMVTLEMELKNQIIANHLLIDFYKTEKENMIDLLIQIEEYINSEGKKEKLFKQSDFQIDENIKNRVYQMIKLILLIRKKAYERYQKSSTEHPLMFAKTVKKRYFQQLFLYSIRMLEYGRAIKPSRFYSAITTILAANELFGNEDQKSSSQKTIDVSSSYLRKNIFISYSHDDKAYLNELIQELEVLKYNNIHYWYDKNIPTGTNWEQKIHDEIEKADMAICLISKNFLKADYIRDVEILAILNKSHENFIIIPILFEDCTWELLTWLKKLQIFPGESKTMKDFSENERNNQFKKIVIRIAEALGVH